MPPSTATSGTLPGGPSGACTLDTAAEIDAFAPDATPSLAQETNCAWIAASRTVVVYLPAPHQASAAEYLKLKAKGSECEKCAVVPIAGVARSAASWVLPKGGGVYGIAVQATDGSVVLVLGLVLSATRPQSPQYRALLQIAVAAAAHGRST
ncbi:MAG: hypothetical protein ABSD78_16780 [Acidimicrobiales bacterium]